MNVGKMKKERLLSQINREEVYKVAHALKNESNRATTRYFGLCQLACVSLSKSGITTESGRVIESHVIFCIQLPCHFYNLNMCTSYD